MQSDLSLDFLILFLANFYSQWLELFVQYDAFFFGRYVPT